MLYSDPIRAGATRTGFIAFAWTIGSTRYGKLSSGEVLTGTPTITEQTTSDLTISNVAVNTAALTGKDGQAIAIGEAVQFKISGQLEATGKYTLAVSATSDGGQTFAEEIQIDVED